MTFALLTILPVTLPEVPPAPICKVPAETVVPPEYVLSALKVSVPDPCLVRLFPPAITFENVTFPVWFTINSSPKLVVPFREIFPAFVINVKGALFTLICEPAPGVSTTFTAFAPPEASRVPSIPILPPAIKEKVTSLGGLNDKFIAGLS